MALNLILISVWATGQAQEKWRGIGIYGAGLDFYGPQSGNYLLQERFNTNSGKTQNRLFWDPAIRLSYWQPVYKNLDLQINGFLSALQYPNGNNDQDYLKIKSGEMGQRNAQPYLSVQAMGRWHFLPRRQYWLSPYAGAGLGGTLRENTLGIECPVGIGVLGSLSPTISLNLETAYAIPLGAKNQSNLQHSIGIVYWWKHDKPNPEPPRIPTPPEPPVLADRDNDGTPDNIDRCPDIPGRKDKMGCPDRDEDGVADQDDLCPDVKGLVQFKGCPDSDQDGIPDNTDDCPKVAGTIKYKGCPVPDRDQDGFNDEVDACPDLPSSGNNGCPEIKQAVKEQVNQAAQGIEFETGSAKIRPQSLKNLDKIVEILKADNSLRVDISGHTDNVGSPAGNLILSEQRAEACQNYLISKGIEAIRIQSKGYGDTQPVADNNTTAGRARNRRTEFLIRNH